MHWLVKFYHFLANLTLEEFLYLTNDIIRTKHLAGINATLE